MDVHKPIHMRSAPIRLMSYLEGGGEEEEEKKKEERRSGLRSLVLNRPIKETIVKGIERKFIQYGHTKRKAN